MRTGPIATMSATINSYIKGLTASELEQLVKDAKKLCGPCPYDSPTGCTAKECSVLKIIEQVNAEFSIRNKK